MSISLNAKQVTNTRGRVIFASLAGTAIEFYDFYVYATAAVLVFPKLFFSNTDPTVALLASFAVFGVAFIARPIGSVLFGHFGDRIGRKKTLVASLLTMGLATFFIGLLPTALTPGWEVAAPVLLVILRLAQGLGLGGEWSGAVVLATENAPPGQSAIWGTFPAMGAPIGFICANGIFLTIGGLLDDAQFQAWGWRVPFLLSALLVIVGLYVRFRLVETPAFQQVLESNTIARLPIQRVIQSSSRQVIVGTCAAIAPFIIFYLLTTFTLSYGTTPMEAPLPGLGYSREIFLAMQIGAILALAAVIAVSGPLAKRFGCRIVLMYGSAGMIIYGLTFVPLFSAGYLGVIAILVIGFALLGFTYGPLGAFLPGLFSANMRYTGSGICFNLASILGAALAPFIAVWLWQTANGSTVLVGLYMSAMALISFLALLLDRTTKNSTYDNTEL